MCRSSGCFPSVRFSHRDIVTFELSHEAKQSPTKYAGLLRWGRTSPGGAVQASDAAASPRPAKPAGERKPTAALTPPPGARSLLDRGGLVLPLPGAGQSRVAAPARGTAQADPRDRLEGAASACARYRKLARTGKRGRVGSLSDSLLEGSGFELPVRGAMNLVFAPSGNWFRPSEIAPIIFVRHSLSDARIPTTKPRFVVGARAVIRNFVTVIDRRTVSGACYPPKRPLGIAQIPGRRPT
jgi:hypothetical protein